MIAVNGQTDEEVTRQTDDEYHTMETNQNPLVDGWKHVRFDPINVVGICIAIVIRARFVANEVVEATVSQVGTVKPFGAIGRRNRPDAIVMKFFHFPFSLVEVEVQT